MSEVSVQLENGLTLERTVLGLIARAVEHTLDACGAEGAEVSVTLLGDAAITELNGRWLGHALPTDVISFPLFDEDEPPVGDVYIGSEQAARQAASNHVALTEELVRLAIHGTLHVLGHDHDQDEDRMKGEMWRLQERLVAEVMAT